MYQNYNDNSMAYSLGMAYVPWQQGPVTYDNMEKAFHLGTIFPDLTKPFTSKCPNQLRGKEMS